MRRLIGIEPEVIQRAPANRIRVLILRKCFSVPSDRPPGLSDRPRLVAVTLIVKCTIVCPAGFLRRRVKAHITDVNSRRHRHAERLNAAIEVLVIQGVLVVPDTGSWVGHFVTHEPDTIIARIRLEPVNRCACPGHDGRLHSHCRTNTCKREIGWAAADGKLPIRDVVIHIALSGMGLAPCIFMGSYILTFGKIRCASVVGRE